MFTYLFWLAVIGITVFAIIKSGKPKDSSQEYARGYWNGYRAREEEVRQNIPVRDGIMPPNSDPEQTHTNWTQETAARATSTVSAEDEKVLKEKRDLNGINMTLYVASFLLVAAAALFIGTSLPESIKFIGTWMITAAFYAAGLLLHARSARLRPAAVAFAGTGLALLPFTGVAMYNFVLPDMTACWFITSFIGAIAFIFATIRLRSQVVAYFAIAFMVSLTTSAPAILHIGLLWQFVSLLVFGSLVTIAAVVFPKHLPGYFRAPIAVSGQWIVPLTLIASLVGFKELKLLDYEIITAVAALYYGAVATSNAQIRNLALLIMRGLVTIFVMLVSYDLSHSWAVLSATLTVVAIVQIALSLLFLPRHVTGDSNNEPWLWIGFGLQVLAPLAAVGSDSMVEIFTLQLLALVATSVVAGFALRRAIVLGFAVYALVLLPIVYGFFVTKPSLNPAVVALICTVMATLALLATVRQLGVVSLHPSLRPPLIAAYSLFTFEALIISIGADLSYRVPLWVTATALLYAMVYIERLATLTWLPNLVLLVTAWWAAQTLLPEDSVALQVLTATWFASLLFYFGYWIMRSTTAQILYGQTMLWSAIGVAGFFGLCLSFNSNPAIVNAAGLTCFAAMIVLTAEGFTKNRLAYVDSAAIVTTISFQRMVAVVTPDLHMTFYTHWWAVVFAALAYLYYSRNAHLQAKVRLIIGLVFLSFFTGIAALDLFDSEVPYRLIFLFEHVGLVVAGLLLSKRLLSIWGMVGVVLAVLWLLSDYTFLLLAIIALGLIGFAVYRLAKKTG